MYFTAGQYPCLRDKPKKERLHIVKTAIRLNRNATVWFLLSFVFSATLGVLLFNFLKSQYFPAIKPSVGVICMSIIIGLCFYIAVLILINTIMYRVVCEYIKNMNDQTGESRTEDPT